jgi:hypothetical protein
MRMTKHRIEGVSAISLVKIGGDTIVRVECCGKWVDVITESSDGSFSHIVEGAKVNDLTDAALG